MALNFSIDALIADKRDKQQLKTHSVTSDQNQAESSADSQNRPSDLRINSSSVDKSVNRATTSTTDANSPFSATSDHEIDESTRVDTYQAGSAAIGGLSQSFQDVLMPHLSMAHGNPFLLNSVSCPGADPVNGMSSLTQQYWMEVLQHAHGSRAPFGAESAAAAAGLFIHQFRKPKRIRTAFSPHQLMQLEHAFDRNHYVIGQERKQLAQKLQLSETQVKVWFQNRRTKHKRVKTDDDEKSADSGGEADMNSCDLEGVSVLPVKNTPLMQSLANRA